MSTIIKGLLSQNLPWGLVLCGVSISLVLELCGIRSLSFAVGSYLPIATTAPIFVGGVVRWARRAQDRSGQRIRDQLGHALQLRPDRRRLDRRDPLRRPLRPQLHRRRRRCGDDGAHPVPARGHRRPDRRRPRLPRAGDRSRASRTAYNWSSDDPARRDSGRWRLFARADGRRAPAGAGARAPRGDASRHSGSIPTSTTASPSSCARRSNGATRASR